MTLMTKAQLLERYTDNYREITALKLENAKLKSELQLRVDTSMVQSRNAALGSLATMADAVESAIKMVVGKEVL